jgi:hypothetical protein
MDCSCEYTEYAVADSQQGVVLQLGAKNFSPYKKFIMKCYTGPQAPKNPLE